MQALVSLVLISAALKLLNSEFFNARGLKQHLKEMSPPPPEKCTGSAVV